MSYRRDWLDELLHPFLDILDTPMDVRENEKEFDLEVDLPGVEPADIEVAVSGDKLSIRAERKWAKTEGKSAFQRSFSQSFSLPATVDSQGISATYSHGVLKVAVPKRAGPASRRVEIKET